MNWFRKTEKIQAFAFNQALSKFINVLCIPLKLLTVAIVVSLFYPPLSYSIVFYTPEDAEYINVPNTNTKDLYESGMTQLYNENPGQVNVDGGISLLKEAANNGHVIAQRALGDYYYNKWKTEDAFKWYSMAAEKGHVRAQSQLGDMYYWGFGAEKNYDLSLKWQIRSAENNYTTAYNTLKSFYLSEKALDWLIINLAIQ